MKLDIRVHIDWLRMRTWKYIFFRYFNYDEKFKICAYTEGKTACWGDSGGPFMCEQNDQFILYGAVGGGGRCGLYHYSGFFANVFNHMDFIKEIVEYSVSERKISRFDDWKYLRKVFWWDQNTNLRIFFSPILYTNISSEAKNGMKELIYWKMYIW